VAEVLSFEKYQRRRFARRVRRVASTSTGAVAAIAMTVFVVTAATTHAAVAAERPAGDGPFAGNACALLDPATVTRYLPGAGPGTAMPDGTAPRSGACLWTGPGGRPESLEVSAAVDPATESATGPGTRTTATFTTVVNSPTALLTTRSGDAEVQVTYTALPATPRATVLATTTAISHAALSNLGGPGD
jgi:hypothetical protein